MVALRACPPGCGISRSVRYAGRTPAGWTQCAYCLYADAKWSSPASAAAHLACVRSEPPTTWNDWAGNYLLRAVRFGLETPQGRQALGKTIVTLTHVLETAIELWGPMPAPGVASGEIQEWER